MKYFYSSIIFLAQCTTLFGHGFHTTTSVLLPDNTLQSINTLCYRAQKKKFFTASYDTASAQNTEAQVVRSGRSKTNCYIQLELQKEKGVSSLCNTIACTPTQEFYAAFTHQWVPACKLKVGDELLCAHNKAATVSSIKLIDEAINVYTIEVENSHAFFVSECLILTHNMILPMAFHVGLSIPFSAGIGGTFGCVLGPPTIFVGAAVGCIVGTVATIMYCGKVPCYNLEPYNIPFLKQCLDLQPKTEFAEAPCEPKMTTFTDQVTTCIDSQGTTCGSSTSRTSHEITMPAGRQCNYIQFQEKETKDRKQNTITKPVITNALRGRYKHGKNNIYFLEPNAEPLTTSSGKSIEAIKWDHCHNEIEAYTHKRCKKGSHAGALDPATLKIYKPGDKDRSEKL